MPALGNPLSAVRPRNFFLCGICRNPSVTGGYSLWTKVRRKGKGPPWPGGSLPPWRDWNHEALVSSGTGRGPRPPASFGGSSVRSPGLWASRPMLPARTARTPRPQQSLHPAPLHGRVTICPHFSLTICTVFHTF